MLANGLTLIVHEDHKAPIVAVNVWYHVGSKNERPGKTGFAHLFEHLMFNGSENFNDDYFKAARAGRRHRPERHHQRRPHQLLPERADHGARPGAVAGVGPHGPPARRDRPGRLDEQRGVVQNEKRQGENQPYGKRRSDVVTRTLYPAGPSVLAGRDRLDGGPRTPPVLEDVKEWFATYYGADNAVLVLAGDMTSRRGASKGRAVLRRHPCRARR